MVMGPEIVIEVPGQTPRSPVRTVEPVVVTAAPANTAKVLAVPRNAAPAACAQNPRNVSAAMAENSLCFIMIPLNRYTAAFSPMRGLRIPEPLQACYSIAHRRQQCQVLSCTVIRFAS